MNPLLCIHGKCKIREEYHIFVSKAFVAASLGNNSHGSYNTSVSMIALKNITSLLKSSNNGGYNSSNLIPSSSIVQHFS